MRATPDGVVDRFDPSRYRLLPHEDAVLSQLLKTHALKTRQRKHARLLDCRIMPLPRGAT